jgi:hypothetical protein
MAAGTAQMFRQMQDAVGSGNLVSSMHDVSIAIVQAILAATLTIGIFH